MTSAYFKKLDKTDQARYLSKLSVGLSTLPDPLCEQNRSLFSSTCEWPNVTYPDIFNYLINTTGEFTKESLKTYKSLDAYNYFLSGKVRTLESFKSDEGLCVTKGLVEPGQRTVKSSKDLYGAWFIAKMDGEILNGHCTCMAGLGEVCSHVGATLFAVMTTVQTVGEESCTSKLCSWISVKKRASTAPIVNIQFKKNKFGSTQPVDVTEELPSLPRPKTPEISPTKTLFNIILKNTRQCTLSTVVPSDDSSITDTASENEENIMPSPFLDRLVYKGDCGPGLYSRKERESIEKMTRDQSNSMKWFTHRKGRITASILHKITHMREATDKGTIVNEILQGRQTELNVPAVKWGKEKENVARKGVVEKLKMEGHESVAVIKCGFVISGQDPYFGASPDGILSCDCCGDRVLEIKCPESLKNVDVCSESFVPPKRFCIVNGNLSSKHEYYSQIQAQMAVTGLSHGVFAVWTLKAVVLVDVGFNAEFWAKTREVMRMFYQRNVLPVIQDKCKKKLVFDTGM